MLARSLVLITVDCLRADHVGFLGYAAPTTPFMDSLARESIIFSNAIVAGAPTYFSFPAIMASRYPLALGRDTIGIPPSEITTATVLKNAGYSTGAFLAGNPYLSPRFGYETGFDTFRDHLDAKLSDTARPDATKGIWAALNRKLAAITDKVGALKAVYEELYFEYCQRIASPAGESFDSLRRFPSADVIVDEACDWLTTQRDKPFFLWLHLMDAHSPYYPDEAALRQMTTHSVDASQSRYINSYWNRGDLGKARLERKLKAVISLYDAGIRSADSQIARMAEHLRRLNRWNNCVLAVTADHGEEFLEHGGRFHSPATMNEEVIRVPLLLRTPSALRHNQVKSPFSLVNLAPTLLEAIGIPQPEQFQGESYWAKVQQSLNWDDAAIVESVGVCNNPFRAGDRLGSRMMAVRGPRFKLIIDFASSEDQLFDLQNDPGELHPLARDAEKAVRRNLLEIARDHIRESTRLRDPSLRLSARLRDLRLQFANPFRA